MVITREMYKEAYKTYNILMGYSRKKLEMDLDSIKIYDFLRKFNPNQSTQVEKEKFGKLLGILIFQQKTGKTIIPNAKELTLSNLPIHGIAYAISPEQINYLLKNIECSPEEAHSIEQISDFGNITTDYKKLGKTEDLATDYKYKVGFKLSDVFNMIDSSKVNTIYESIKNYTNNGKEIFDNEELTNNPLLQISKADDETKFKKDYSQAKIKKTVRENRESQLKNELNDKINLYMGAKKAVKEKNWASRYLNPFNWVKTYRENKNLSDLEKDFKNNFGLSKSDINFLNDKIDDPSLRYNEPNSFVFAGCTKKESQEIKMHMDLVKENPSTQLISQKKGKEVFANGKILITKIDDNQMDIDDVYDNQVYDFQKENETVKEEYLEI